MTHDEIRATLTLCLLASFADGEKHEREREQIRQVAEGLAGAQGVNLPGLKTRDGQTVQISLCPGCTQVIVEQYARDYTDIFHHKVNEYRVLADRLHMRQFGTPPNE